MCDVVQARLELGWSPEQIAGYLRTHYAERVVSPETIDQGLDLPHRGVLRRDLTKKLRTRRTLHRPRPRRRADGRSTRLVDPGRLIDARPMEVESRAVPGHWEGDLITGAFNATAIATQVEPASRYVQFAALATDHTAAKVCPGVVARFERLPEPMRLSLTWDQGSEMAAHATVAAREQ